MTVHEFGDSRNKSIILIHPAAVMWDYFNFAIARLQDKFHLIVPALPGYDKAHPQQDYTSVEEIADELERWLADHGYSEVEMLYGCSMGGGIVLRMLADHRIFFRNAVCDGGITPYQLPYLATRFIALRDFLMVSMGKVGGLNLLEKAFSTEEYSKEDLTYVADVLHFMSLKTVWRTFDSCNNYKMPEHIPLSCDRLQYWYGEKEKKDRAWDIRYVKEHFPYAEFVCFPGLGHAAMASSYPDKMAEQLTNLIDA